MYRLKRTRKRISEINIVPYIDVMLVLLVIFMLTTPILMQGIKINLPQSKSQKIHKQSKMIIITLSAKHLYFLNTTKQPSTPITYTKLQNKLTHSFKNNPDKNNTVYIRADENLPYGDIIKMMSFLKTIGVNNISLITKEKPKEMVTSK